MTKRSDIDSLIDIMKAIDKHPNFAASRVLAYAGVGYPKGKELLKKLNDGGLINIGKRERSYRGSPGRRASLTTKGRDWLKRVSMLFNECGLQG